MSLTFLLTISAMLIIWGLYKSKINSDKKELQDKQISNLVEIKKFLADEELKSSGSHTDDENIELFYANYNGGHAAYPNQSVVAISCMYSILVIKNIYGHPNVEIVAPYYAIGKPEILKGDVPQLMNLNAAAIMANAMARASATTYIGIPIFDAAGMTHEVILSNIQGITPEKFSSHLHQMIVDNSA